MPASNYLRRLSRQFSISAPRMAVRTHLGWPWRVGLAVVFVAVIAGMWWWGFDFGQLLGGFNQRENQTRLAALEADTATAQRDAAALRARNTQLESELAMMRGLQTTLERQQQEIQQENARLKDELSFLQHFFAEPNKTAGVGIQRLAVDSRGGEVVRFRALVAQGGTPKSDFEGQLSLQAELVPTAEAVAGSQAMTFSMPDANPDSALPLKLRFKYYQRIEGTFRIPPGYALRALTARAYESGVVSPRATRTLTLP